MKCIYSYEDGDYCLKHSHGAADVHCTGEDGCPDFTPNKTFTIGKPFRITADMIGEADFSLTKDLIQRIVEAQNIALKNEIEANAVVVNGRKYGMLKNHPGLTPAVFGMRLETWVDMPDDYDFIVQYREPELLTNADRIRSMTDEELAAFLAQQPFRQPVFDGWLPLCSYAMGSKICHPNGCKSCWLDWLKAPVEEGKG